MSTSSTNIPLGGESCPKCKSTEAWHGVIVEPGEADRFACDECGFWMTVQVTHPKPPKRRRPFNFTVEVQNGALFVDVGERSILAFRPGHYLALGDNWELLTAVEAERREEQATETGREVGRREAEEAFVAEVAS